MSINASETHICVLDCQPVARSCMPFRISRPRVCCCSSTASLLRGYDGDRNTLADVTNEKRRRDSDCSVDLYPTQLSVEWTCQTRMAHFVRSTIHAKPPARQPSGPNLTRSTSHLSEIYDRMFPDPPPLTHAPALLSPIETLDVTATMPSFPDLLEVEQISESPVPSNASTPPLSPHAAFQNAEVGYRSVLSTTPIGFDTPLTPPYTPGRQRSPPPITFLSSPFTPKIVYNPAKDIYAPEQDIEEIVSLPTDDTRSAVSPQPVDIGLSTSVSIHSPNTPQYSARLIRRTPRPSPSQRSLHVYQFPLVPGSTVSPTAFSLKTCNAWIDNLGTPSTGRSRNASGASQLSVLTRRGFATCSVDWLPQRHDRSRNQAQDWTTTMDLPPSSADDLTALEVRQVELQSMQTLDSHEMRALLPELHLPDWTLDIHVGPDAFYPEQTESLRLRSILRQGPSTDRVTLSTPGRSVKWAPDDALAQMRYIHRVLPLTFLG
ncbi:hypothetical protein CALCODRAFT_490049 [Calocera cornea HHB12733]|uniref:Uncharacterized protein n=1 Tax=Calocera cornea HHB12733 TaxID=1353952 RepID=A0A165JU65_9BASI|nr:hypothetical protein CALCODRAFT_490049 [Calocera cornea HHB12733]